ncbi:MAG: pantetheine-phosphate adenylyltransferase [Christensenella sp.]|nr:pantetheine-phosphate adenylyltransferase [Christensenella sp.]
MKTCIYPGSFDPITKGHMDIIKRAASLFETVYVGVLYNSAKKGMFPACERVKMVEAAVSGLANVKTVSFEGLLVDLLRELKVNIIIRGLRTNSDLELEQQLSYVNNNLLPGTETFALFSRPEMSFVSSTIVRELITFHADISEYVPDEVVTMINGGTKHESI